MFWRKGFLDLHSLIFLLEQSDRKLWNIAFLTLIVSGDYLKSKNKKLQKICGVA